MINKRNMKVPREAVVKTINKNNFSIDIMKFLCSILVICIHTEPLKEFNEYLSFGLVNYVSRIAVPFFFMTSGYYFALKFQKEDGDIRIIKDYLYNLLKVYVGWSIVYFPLFLYEHSKYQKNLSESVLIYIKKFLFLGSYYHLWYIPALFFGIFLLFFALKINKLKKLLLISFFLYIIGLFDDSYYGILTSNAYIKNIFDIYNQVFITTRNGLFFGLVFVSCGGFIANSQISITRKKSLIWTSISFLLLFIEVFLLKTFSTPKDLNMYLMLLPLEVFLLLFLLNTNLKANPSISKYLRNYSTTLYFVHPLCIFLILQFFKQVSIAANTTLLFVLTLVMSLSVIYVINQIKNSFNRWQARISAEGI